MRGRWRQLGPMARTLIATCGVFLTIIAVEIRMLPADPIASIPSGEPADLVPVDSQADSNVQAIKMPPITTYREISERPLFTEGRRPPPPAKAAVNSVKSVQIASQWKLTGVVLAGDDSVAHVQGVRDRKTQRLKKGMRLNGWELRSIDADKVLLTNGASTVTLDLYDEPAGRPPR